MKGAWHRFRRAWPKSPSGGTYWNAIYDYTNASKLTFIVNAPITHTEYADMSILNPGIPSFTWATKPTVANWPSYSAIFITDVGAGGSLWNHNGTYWRPVNRSVTIACGYGSLAVPLVTAAGISGQSSLFTIPGGSPLIPANMLIPGSSVVEIRSRVRKRNANATGLIRFFLGTAGNASDLLVEQLSTGSQNLSDVRVGFSVWFPSATVATSDYSLTGDGVGGVGAMVDVSTNINTASAMSVSIGNYSGSPSDLFDLIEYSVAIKL